MFIFKLRVGKLKYSVPYKELIEHITFRMALVVMGSPLLFSNCYIAYV